jgi:hypothetical protein
MFPAISEEVAIGRPHAHHECHVDPYATQLDVRIDCTLTQNGKETGIIHLGDGYNDPIMKVQVGLRGPLLHHLCGWLCVRVHLECIGTGPEEDYFPDPKMKPIEGDDTNKCCELFEPDDWCYYDFEVTIPKRDFEAFKGDCGEFCCFAVTATSYDRCERPGHIGCFCRGPCVMIHQAPQA